jgi:predicted Fe-Mo cluster-binding NifX family protein
MRVAVTSQNFRTVTSHAGKARRFIVYDVRSGMAPVEIERIDLPKEMSFHAYRDERIHPVPAAGVERLATGGCGEGFRARMARLGIMLIVTDVTDPVAAAALAAEQEVSSSTSGATGNTEGGGCNCHHH